MKAKKVNEELDYIPAKNMEELNSFSDKQNTVNFKVSKIQLILLNTALNTYLKEKQKYANWNKEKDEFEQISQYEIRTAYEDIIRIKDLIEQFRKLYYGL